jgi:hypothetical protein
VIDSFDAAQALRPVLNSGERLLWAGQPAQGLRLQASDLFRLPFGLAVAAFVVVWEVLAFRPKTPVLFRFVGIPFLAVGFHLAIGRFFAEARRRSRTYYGVTDRRVLIRTGASAAALKAFSLADHLEISCRERPDGSGTIIFGPSPPFYGWIATSGWLTSGRSHPPLFDSIPSVQRVYTVLRAAQAAARRVEA